MTHCPMLSQPDCIVSMLCETWGTQGILGFKKYQCWTVHFFPPPALETLNGINLLRCCVTFPRSSCLFKEVWWLWICVFCLDHTFTCCQGAQHRRTVEAFCSSFHPQSNQTLCYLIQMSLSCCVYQGLCWNVFSLSDDDKAWSVIYARLLCF